MSTKKYEKINVNNSLNNSHKANTVKHHCLGICVGIFSLTLLALCTTAAIASDKNTEQQLDPTDLFINYTEATTNSTEQIRPIQLTGNYNNRTQQAKLLYKNKTDINHPQNNPDTTITANTRSKRQLWLEAASPPSEPNENNKKNKLQAIIQQVRGAKFDRKQKDEYHAFEDKNQTPQPNPSTKTPTDTITQSPQPRLQLPLTEEPITGQTMQLMQNLIKDTQKLDNPFELAEILSANGHFQQASVLYRMTLGCIDPNEPDPAQNRVWILLQLANCLRHTDPAKAMKIYRQLITEYPDSPWTELAKTQHRLVHWLQTDRPQTLINQSGISVPAKEYSQK